MRREREERSAGRSEGAALAAAAATSGRAVLVSGITVLIAMAGMFLSGDKTFMSFSVGTMLVVAVAMLGSLTVLPAVLSKLGDRVEKGRIPFVHRLRRADRATAASGARSSTASSGTRSSRPSPQARCSWRWRCRRSACTPPQTGIDGISSPAVEPFARIIDAFPGTPEPAVVAIKADDVNAAPVRAAIAELKRKALATGQMNAPINVDDEPRRHRRQGRDPARRERHRRRLDRGRSQPCATSVLPRDGRQARRRRVRRHRPDRELAGLQQARSRARSRTSSASCCCSRSGSCSSRSARS